MSNRWIFALSMTILWSIVFVTAMNDVTIGICLGICIGVAFGLLDCAKDTEDTDRDGK